MIEVKTVLLVLLYWMSGQGEQAETKSAFRWTDSVVSCQKMMADMDKALKEKHGPAMMVKGVCLTENQVEQSDPDLPENQKLIP